ncbi:major capsid protein P2 [Algicola sagamiensis]|uniref:major capsid protein P2 n=1 Tax=Algicola sagamiensis TaxID=163869 RepID=UPI0003822484|nr:major capsid protein P2 [Algicola sagamiensis]
MFRMPKKLNNFTTAEWGKTAVLHLQTGPVYEEIHLLTNLKKEDIREVRLLLNGDNFYRLSGFELDMLERYKCNYVEDGIFVLPFYDLTAQSIVGTRYTGLVTKSTDNLTLEVDLVELAPGSNREQLQLEAHAFMGMAQNERYFLPRFRKHIMQAHASGLNEFTSLPHGPQLTVKRMYFKCDKIKKLEIYRDNRRVFECDQRLNRFQQTRLGRAPNDDYFIFDPVVSGYAWNERFTTAHQSELKFSVTLDEPVGTIEILVEEVEQERVLPKDHNPFL